MAFGHLPAGIAATVILESVITVMIPYRGRDVVTLHGRVAGEVILDVFPPSLCKLDLALLAFYFTGVLDQAILAQLGDVVLDRGELDTPHRLGVEVVREC